MSDTDGNDVREPVEAYAELARITLTGSSLHDVLTRVADLAAAVIPGVEDVSVTLVERDRARTAAFHGPSAAVLDERQYDAGEGPCLDAAVTGETVLVPDTATDTLYPVFSAQASGHGIRALVAIGLATVDGTTGALNVYAHDADVLTEKAMAGLSRFAAYAAVAVANAAAYSGAIQEVEQMKEAMTSRAVIEQAKGMIMYARRCDAEEAFGLLRETSMTHNRKLRDIAEGLVTQTLAGGEPTPGPRAG